MAICDAPSLRQPVEATAEPMLDRRLREAAKHKMTPAEVFEQRVSFVYGMLSHKSPLTKADVRAMLIERG